ncbi:hypothetical protein CGRA01v4_08085 [Colletotrichum graminicola]|nr:hypothetical protein CGRA01v4_08085 [Colletotrichum graminicola]
MSLPPPFPSTPHPPSAPLPGSLGKSSTPCTCTAPPGSSHTAPLPPWSPLPPCLFFSPSPTPGQRSKWMEPKLKEKCFPFPATCRALITIQPQLKQTHRQTKIGIPFQEET